MPGGQEVKLELQIDPNIPNMVFAAAAAAQAGGQVPGVVRHGPVGGVPIAHAHEVPGAVINGQAAAATVGTSGTNVTTPGQKEERKRKQREYQRKVD